MNNAAWKIFGFQYQEAIIERDNFLKKIERCLGLRTASKVRHHVDVAIRRSRADAQPNPAIVKLPEFFELLALEMAIQEIADRIEATGKALC